MTREEAIRSCGEAEKIISTWPEWKKAAVRAGWDMSGTNKVPREIVTHETKQ